MAYHHGEQLHRRKKISRRFFRLSALLSILFVVIAGYIFVDWVVNNLKNGSIVSNSSEATVRSANVSLFRTKYFQFQTDKSWREATESRDKRFIYRSYDGLLVNHEIIIEIDNNVQGSLDNEQTTRVIPIEILKNRLHAVGDISPHCRDIINDDNDRQQQIISYRQTLFPCAPDSTAFLVVAAVVGGNEKISVDLDPNETRTYKIMYRDSTFSPSGRPLANIINTFQILK